MSFGLLLAMLTYKVTETFDEGLDSGEADVLTLVSVGKVFDKSIESSGGEADFCKGRLFDLMEWVCEVVFDPNGRR